MSIENPGQSGQTSSQNEQVEEVQQDDSQNTQKQDEVEDGTHRNQDWNYMDWAPGPGDS
jgi:hypothetical protein